MVGARNVGWGQGARPGGEGTLPPASRGLRRKPGRCPMVDPSSCREGSFPRLERHVNRDDTVVRGLAHFFLNFLKI